MVKWKYNKNKRRRKIPSPNWFYKGEFYKVDDGIEYIKHLIVLYTLNE